MAVAIGSSASVVAGGGQPSPAALRAEIARYRHQLSDSINCASAKTLEGKAHIQELSSRISADQQRIKQIEAQQPTASASVKSGAAGDTYTQSGGLVSNAGQGNRVSVFA